MQTNCAWTVLLRVNILPHGNYLICKHCKYILSRNTLPVVSTHLFQIVSVTKWNISFFCMLKMGYYVPESLLSIERTPVVNLCNMVLRDIIVHLFFQSINVFWEPIQYWVLCFPLKLQKQLRIVLTVNPKSLECIGKDVWH